MKKLTLLICFILISAIIYARQVEQYTIFELELKGPSAGNPFTDVQLSAEFRLMNRSLFCEGFYDGNGIYRIRFMPDQTGEWTYSIRSNIPQLDSKKGSIICTNPSADNHGPVKVRNTFDLIARIAAFRNVWWSMANEYDNIWNKETYLLKENEFYLYYYGNSQQAMARVMLPKQNKFRLEIIDAWNMTITPVGGEFTGMTEIPLPGLPYLAVRAIAINGNK